MRVIGCGCLMCYKRYMNPIDQLAEEAWDEIRRNYDVRDVTGRSDAKDGPAIILAAIEKATGDLQRRLEYWHNAAETLRAAQEDNPIDQLAEEILEEILNLRFATPSYWKESIAVIKTAIENATDPLNEKIEFMQRVIDQRTQALNSRITQESEVTCGGCGHKWRITGTYLQCPKCGADRYTSRAAQEK